MDVKLRGIYATALTGLFMNEGWGVVQPSAAISARFDAEFSFDEPAVEITMTSDREGVLVTGMAEAVVSALEVVGGVGADTVMWEAGLPRGTVREGAVIETTESGGIIACDTGEVFLPFDRADTYISEGETVTVQVVEPSPPWNDRRPSARTGRLIFGGLAHLERTEGRARADVSDKNEANALVRETEVLPIDVPSGWRVRWQPSAIDAGLEAKTAAVRELCEYIQTVEQPAPVSPESSTWVWFGRDSRRALDEVRESHVTTIPGHHRIKASSETAGKAVDFVERLELTPGHFPVETVFGVFGPRVGDSYRIDHGKPEGNRFTLGEGTVIDVDEETITVRREMTAGGEYDGLGVERESGDVAMTNFKEGRWWYPTVYRDAESSVKGTYVNICTPVELFPTRAVYLDLHVDIVRYPDGSTARLDDDELDTAEDTGMVSRELAEKARSVADAVEAGLD